MWKHFGFSLVKSIFLWRDTVRFQFQMFKLFVTYHYLPFVSLTTVGGEFKPVTPKEPALAFVIPGKPYPV